MRDNHTVSTQQILEGDIPINTKQLSGIMCSLPANLY